MMPAGLLLRLPLVGLALAAAPLGALQAARTYWRNDGAGAAPSYLAGDPLIGVKRADAQLATKPEDSESRGKLAARDPAAIGSNARAALAIEPLDAAAMRQVAMAGTTKGNPERLASLVLAQRIDRRDLSTQLALVEPAVRAGDVAAVLAHYDRAMAVHGETAKLLLPLLSRNLGDVDIRTALVPYASRQWFAQFLTGALSRGAAPADVVALLAAVRPRVTDDIARDWTKRVLAGLIGKRAFADARALLAATPGLESDLASSLAFTPATTDPALKPLSWTLTDGAAATARADGKGGLAVSIASERVATVAARTTLLAPGIYRIAMRLTWDAGAPPAALGAKVVCNEASGTAPLWQGAWQQPSDGSARAIEAQVTVPVGCNAQSWQLVARSATTDAPSQVYIKHFALGPARGPGHAPPPGRPVAL